MSQLYELETFPQPNHAVSKCSPLTGVPLVDYFASLRDSQLPGAALRFVISGCAVLLPASP